MKTLMVLSSFCYFLGMVKFFLHLATRRNVLFYLGTAMITVGFLLHTAMLFSLSAKTGHGPYTNPFEQASFFAWTTMGALITALLYFRTASVGAFVSPIGFLAMFYSFILPVEGEATLHKELGLTLHLTLSLLALSAFAVMCAASVMYLLKEKQLKKHTGTGWMTRIPDLNTLDVIFQGSLVFGFPLITVGMIAALLYSKGAYGSFIGPDPARVVPLLIVWLVYAALMGGRLIYGWRGHALAKWGAWSFVAALGAIALHVLL